MHILYEDNHLIIVNKQAGDIVQGDKTGDAPLSDIIKDFIKVRDKKPGNVFLGVVHRLDRPVSGVCLFAKTSKALARMNALFAKHEEVRKTYWAIVGNRPPKPEGTLVHWLTRDEKRNMARAYEREVPNSKRAHLDYRTLCHSDRYWLLEVTLHTGRHHQIRCQLSKIGCPIKGDLKYGAPRSNPDGSISLHARRLDFIHPVTQKEIAVEAPVPNDKLWQTMEKQENPL
ncbi:MAG: RluA family pseudouridine synthase [Bacteroidaceae bacterium]|nr:RluA family pseudouridine synthase [Bacteroidaceae bacterium]